MTSTPARAAARRATPGCWARVLLCGLVLSATGASAQVDSSDGAAARARIELPVGLRPDAGSRWYLQRLAADPSPREDHPADRLPSVVDDLQALLQDGGVPGFYDGQFAATADRFDELVRVAHDRDMHQTMRIMAVMALQEAADGEPLAEVLEPLVLAPQDEFQREKEDFWTSRFGAFEIEPVRRLLDADLSRHARFALAKDGQPQHVLDKIRVMEHEVDRRREYILDPSVTVDGSVVGLEVIWWRNVWFDIGYHYQQFDDFASAAAQYRALTDTLRGDDVRWAWYNLACIASIQGLLDEAMEHLGKAESSGFLDVEWLEEDGDLAPLHGRADFDALRRRLRGLGPDEPLPPPGTPIDAPLIPTGG